MDNRCHLDDRETDRANGLALRNLLIANVEPRVEHHASVIGRSFVVGNGDSGVCPDVSQVFEHLR